MCTCFLEFVFSNQHAGRGFFVLLMFKSTGSSAQERKNSQLFQQEECLLYECLFSEKAPERSLCSVFETGVFPSFDHTVLTDPNPLWYCPQSYRFICSVGSLMPFFGLYVFWEWTCSSSKPLDTKIFWRTFIITKWAFFSLLKATHVLV